RGAARPRRRALRRLHPHRRRAAHQRRALAARRRGARARGSLRHERRHRVVPPGGARRRRLLTLLALAGGLALLGWLLHHTGFQPLWERLRILGWAAPVIFLPLPLGAILDARGGRGGPVTGGRGAPGWGSRSRHICCAAGPSPAPTRSRRW